MTIVGITPARGGSKGILRKNIKSLAGKPLIAYTIERALEAHFIDKYFVSTEDKEIAKISKSYGAEVIDRPSEFATDESPIIDTLKDFVTKVPQETTVLLQCTSPIRNPGLIDKCIMQHIKDNWSGSTATGFMVKWQPYGTNTQRRQDYTGYFYDDGSVYVIWSGLIKQGRLFGDKLGQVMISREEAIEIDDEFDFWLCEQILKRKKNEKD